MGLVSEATADPIVTVATQGGELRAAQWEARCNAGGEVRCRRQGAMQGVRHNAGGEAQRKR